MLKTKFTINKKASDEIASLNRIRKFEQLRMKEEFYSERNNAFDNDVTLFFLSPLSVFYPF